MKNVSISIAIHKRSCTCCRRELHPGTEHLKIYHANICKMCFIGLSFKILGTEPFKEEFIKDKLPKLLSDEI